MVSQLSSDLLRPYIFYIKIYRGISLYRDVSVIVWVCVSKKIRSTLDDTIKWVKFVSSNRKFD